MNHHQKFIIDSSKKAFDIEHRNKLKFNILQYQKASNKGVDNYENLELAKDFLAEKKSFAVNNLAKLLISFENKIASRGTHVV